MRGVISIEKVGKQFVKAPTKRPQSLLQILGSPNRWRRPVERFWALKDVSFEVAPGEMLGVVGANGAGKSTLLRLVGGTMQPDTGKIRARGRIGGLLQLGIGFHGELTGRENIFTNGIIAGLTRREVAERLDSIIAFAELEEFIDGPLRTYSTGMRMRLGFSIAIHTDPDILLIDEVLTVGDLAFEHKCLERIERYKANGCAIILVSHGLGQVEQHCEKALWLRSGEVAAYGPSAVVVKEYGAAMHTETRRRTPDSHPVRITAGGRTLRMDENRFGSLEMEIEDVLLWDSDKRLVSEIHGGEALTIEIRYHAQAPVEAPIFGVSVTDDKGQTCFDTSTEADRVSLPVVDGHGSVYLHFGRLDLNDGNYFVSVGIHERSWTYTFDYHWQAYPLQVRTRRHSRGILSPPRQWMMKKNDVRSALPSL